MAVWRSADAMREIPGCWLIVAGQGMVVVSFLDGERANIPVQMLKQPTRL
jgi:hypothetical protein